MIELFNATRDDVIKSSVAQGSTTYRYALNNILPLINKFEEQRKVQRRKFYERLKQDILRGCLMPPITLAFVDPASSSITDRDILQTYVKENIGSGYVLDGMQRLTTLQDAMESGSLDLDRPIFVNIIIAEKYDLLLYRMITLNNGQKPMTARHQIEMLTRGMLDIDHLNINIVSEKDTEQQKINGAFQRADIAAAYTAFLTDSVNNDNSRIIESKLDEILVGKVMESDLTNAAITFSQVLRVVDKMSAEVEARDWLRLGNNLIGFAVGAKDSFEALDKIKPNAFSSAVLTFDQAFKGMNASKINVGKMRRELSKLFISNIEQYVEADVDDLTQAFFDATLVD